MRKSEPFYSTEAQPEPFVDPKADPNVLFSITQVIGNVYADVNGSTPPHVVAFEILGRNGQDGTFYFPNEDGTMVEVTINNFHPER